MASASSPRTCIGPGPNTLIGLITEPSIYWNALYKQRRGGYSLIVLGAKKLRQTIGMGTPQDRAPTPYENDKALHFLRHHLCATLKNEYMGLRSPLTLWTALKKRFEKLKQASYKEYDEMIDIMQVSGSHDEVLHKNFVFQPPGKSVGLERRRGKRDGKKAAEKSKEKAPAAQGAQGGKGKKEAKPARNDKPYGQQDQTCYKCGIWGPLELYLRGALARRRRILGQQECQGVRRGTHG
uniref:Retrotransposon protein, putative, Ty1-copia subclass n=1 Tax=Oryza sativa subsp. japonica TaxID=39947 RepID=Q10JK4_ORYSJ|nr:hypothetical protein LOC_Os03g30320 [Oryza sativa Japonica Group]